MNRKAAAFAGRVRRGEIVKPLYLTYYYTYLSAYDRRHGTRFSNSQAPVEMGSDDIGGTGNFPAHPRLVLHVASRMGFTDLAGVEYGAIPFELSVINVGDRAELTQGNALDIDLAPYRAVVFFNPFRGELAVSFFEGLPETVDVVLTINHDPVIEPVLERHGLRMEWSYGHRVYENFNAKLWRRTGSP